ncbi:hypothetical protein [Globicatella sulfidifaciens]|mgnify:CR=1 FL=1|uniref:Pilus assembly protein n=1 Tax=Globicatella sulfidifaciens TaxID=136093 RepID=A0A7X8H0Z0_9LACT|nr:hypothetical protein [Globicatella sulfidifaciens]NLJ19344.1 hypothetical protein [Globicatella sulfidifaciens]
MMRLFLKKLKDQEQGMFTLETTLIFPTLFVTTIILILFSLVIYNQVVVYQKAHIIAERVAFTWDNSKKDLNNGQFNIDQYTTLPGGDGLYWRSNAIGTSFIERISPLDKSDNLGLNGKKENRAQSEASSMLASADIVVEAPNFDTINPQVKVTVTSDFKAPEIVTKFLSSDKYTVTAYASVKDPVELIRTTDLIIDYGKQIMNAGKNK